jgi:hypothetical protein
LLHRVVTTSHSLLDPGQLALANTMQLDVMGTMVRFEHDLLEIAGALESNACPFTVIKGAATAHLDYADPSLRQFGDVDLLVAPRDLSRACAILGEKGWTQAYSLPRHHELFTHAITLRNSSRVEVDLHQRVAHRAIGQLIPTDVLMADRIEYDIAGTTLWALADRDRLIHAAVHYVTSRGPYRRLSSTADVLVLAEARCRNSDAVVVRAESWKVRALLERAIADAYSAAELPLNEDWASAFAKPTQRRDQLVDRAYLSEHRRPLTEELAFLRLLNGWRNRWKYMRGYFSTDADYAEHRQRSGLYAQSRYLWSRLRSR